MYKLLIADDDEIICRGLGQCIDWEKWGIEIVGNAFDGEMALEYVEEKKPDICIVDINMPMIDGMELSCLIRQEFPEIKIIMLTAYKGAAYAKMAVQMQIFEYLTKPFSNEEVLGAVNRAVKAIEQERGYRDRVRKNIGIIREKNLEEITAYGSDEKDVIENSPIKSAKHYFQVAILYLKCISAYTEDGEKTGIEDEVACHVAKEKLRKQMEQYKNRYFFMQNRRMVIVSEYQLREEGRDMRTFLEEVLEVIGQEDQIFVTCGVGRVYQGADMLPTSYGEALQVIEQRHGYANKSIVYYNDMMLSGSVQKIDLTLAKKTIKEAIQQNDAEKVQEALSTIFREMRKVKKEDFTVNVFCIMELLHFSWETTEDKEKYESFMKKSGTVLGKMIKARSIGELEEIAEKQFAEFCGYLAEQNTTEIEKKVNQAVAYLEENYANPELSLEEVAKKIQLSSSYLGNSLKKYKKISYINLLNQIRIERAKVFLSNPDIKSYEVAYLVGYNSSQYFSSCFKKTTGSTPGEYRDKVTHGNAK